MSAIMLKSAVAKPTVAARSSKAAPKVAAARANQMMVWRADDNKQFETFSYLPPLTKDQIAKQVDYIVNNGWVPALEFSDAALAYVGSQNCDRIKVTPGYYDNRYWSLWKLPMFGCTDPSQVLTEIAKAARALPNSYVRIAAFDNIRQVQIVSFLVHRPAAAKDYRLPQNRQVQ